MSCSENKEKKFRDVKPKKESMLKKGIGMVQNYASAVASRGIKNTKADKVTKQLRVLSCFGNTHLGGATLFYIGVWITTRNATPTRVFDNIFTSTSVCNLTRIVCHTSVCVSNPSSECS